MAKNKMTDVVPNSYKDYTFNDEEKNLLGMGGSVLLPERFDAKHYDGRIKHLEALILYNPDTDAYEFCIGYLFEETDEYYAYLEHFKTVPLELPGFLGEMAQRMKEEQNNQ